MALAQAAQDFPPAQAQRYVGAQLTLSYDRKQIILERNEVSGELGGQYAELYDFPDRPLEVRWKGHSLPYRVFQKDQRVSPTAAVENKRLGHGLRTVKAQQDVHHAPTVQTNSSRGGYQKRGAGSMVRITAGQRRNSARRPQKPWRCRSDGKHGRPTIKLSTSHPSHRPWKPPKNGASHIPTAPRRRRNKKQFDCHFYLAEVEGMAGEEVVLSPSGAWKSHPGQLLESMPP